MKEKITEREILKAEFMKCLERLSEKEIKTLLRMALNMLT